MSSSPNVIMNHICLLTLFQDYIYLHYLHFETYSNKLFITFTYVVILWHCCWFCFHIMFIHLILFVFTSGIISCWSVLAQMHRFWQQLEEDICFLSVFVVDLFIFWKWKAGSCSAKTLVVSVSFVTASNHSSEWLTAQSTNAIRLHVFSSLELSCTVFLEQVTATQLVKKLPVL
jgi:hypothetical protein